jgi:transposase
MAFELSLEKWKLGFSDGQKSRFVEVAGRDLGGLELAVSLAKKRLGLAEDTPVVSCYEAGRDGFWLHRHLTSLGIRNYVVDPASIEVPRKGRRRKTDRLDVRMLLKSLLRFELCGDAKVWSVCRVPDVEVEDDRRLGREEERLKKEETAHRARIKALLATQGLVHEIGRRGFLSWLQTAKALSSGEPIPSGLQAACRREYKRLQLVWEQQKEIQTERCEQLRAHLELHGDVAPHACSGRARRHQMVLMLASIRSIGLTGAWSLTHELFGWRTFRRGKELGGAVGLTPTPYNSGASSVEQGISKAGNRRVRRLMIQTAWLWLRFQPNTGVSQWFQRRFGDGTKRQRRVGIVAVARKLVVLLWRYLEHGEVADGMCLKPTPFAA